MKYIIIVLLLILGCTTKIEYIDDYGQIKNIEVNDNDITKIEEIVISATVKNRINLNNVSCSYSGFCMSCGLKLDGNFGCGLSFSAFCPGHQNEIRDVWDETYYIKTYMKNSKVYKSVNKTRNRSQLISETTCS